ncbi:endonuclease NucS domain-containing protein [Haloquadratum walsbyi]|uniref:DUF91 family protein n=1 Tax=Haloquadratum walsbyi (strain DSM 16854 / JCM 12705 / C23) TaxID=768065 RepID=G0LNA9_HALWC|nr:endonuclease NucS domain-containing protein [Haloquadratum walsbyi]CCC41915.1 DUF91 family protein [Haloquadratum walsbyi C23]
MILSIEKSGKLDDSLETTKLSDLNFTEPENLQEWIIERPAILGEELLVITSEYAGFQDTLDRLDILAIDTDGKLVVVELKRDRADQTTDLQAIKYASYCATLTAKEVQKEYRSFWTGRDGAEIASEIETEDVSQQFADFLTEFEGDPPITDEGWVDFELSERPRIILAAGSFSTEITSPVLWLTNEYGMDVTCIKIEAYEHQEHVILNSQQIIPIPEAEEYMTRRREKREKQRESSSVRTIELLLRENVLSKGDEVYFNSDKAPSDPDPEWSSSDEFWRAEITGERGQSNNVKWRGKEYSFTGLTKEVLYQSNDRDKTNSLNGYKYWKSPDSDNRTLRQLRDREVGGSDLGDQDE